MACSLTMMVAMMEPDVCRRPQAIRRGNGSMAGGLGGIQQPACYITHRKELLHTSLSCSHQATQHPPSLSELFMSFRPLCSDLIEMFLHPVRFDQIETCIWRSASLGHMNDSSMYFSAMDSVLVSLPFPAWPGVSPLRMKL